MDRNTPIYNELKRYVKSDILPFHMPGHKQGRGLDNEFKQLMPYIDLTEIPGLDNLHQPQGIIQQAQELAAQAFGADQSFFLVNGSSCGIIAMITAVCNPGDKIIIPRDCHKSVIDALVLSGAVPVYIKPAVLHGFNISAGIYTGQLDKMLSDNPDAKAVFITYPNYYGICSHIKEISRIVHAHGKILMVDEAHGSHLYFGKQLPVCALEAGADICVNSLHKTLPAPTQCSILHIKGRRVNEDRLKLLLQMLQTTSPSYIFMAAIDMLRDTMQRHGGKLIDRLIEYNLQLRNSLSDASKIKVLDKKHIGQAYIHDIDITKLLINFLNTGITGMQAEHILRQKYNIQVEMSDLQNILCITTVADDKYMFSRLKQALTDMDRRYKDDNIQDNANMFLPVPKQMLSPRECFYSIIESVNVKNAASRICAERIAVYPPGIPFICPGEQITAEIVDYIDMVKRVNLSVYGASDSTLNTIKVVKE